MNFHDYQALETRLNDTDIYTLIADCDTILAENQTEFIRLLRSALSLSAHVLEKDKSALAHQLAGRLYHHVDKNADIKVFVDSIIPPKNSLYPIYNGYDPLNPAGGYSETMLMERQSIRGMIELQDGRFLSWDKNNVLQLWDAHGTPLTTLLGHINEILGAIELHDGRLLSWSADRTLRIWDADGILLTTLIKHTDKVLCVIELRDGRLLSCSADKTLQIWGSDGTPIMTLIEHKDSVLGAMELRDGRLLSWGADRTLRIWGADGTLITTIREHQRKVLYAIELRDGRLVSCSADKTLRIWGSDGTLITTIRGHISSVLGVIELHDGRLLSWGIGKNLYIWNGDDKPIISLKGHTHTINGAIEYHDGRILSWSRHLMLVWDANGVLLAKYKSGGGGAFLNRYEPTLGGAMLIRAEGIVGALILRDRRLLLWGWHMRIWSDNILPVFAHKAHENYVKDIRKLQNGLIGSLGYSLRIWNREGVLVNTLGKDNHFMQGVIELQDGKIISWGWHGLIHFWDANGKIIAKGQGYFYKYDMCGVIELSDGRVLSWGSELRFWSPEGELIMKRSMRRHDITHLIELSNGCLLSWNRHGKDMVLWSADGIPIRTLKSYGDTIKDVTELPDGRLLSWSVYKNITFELWDNQDIPIDQFSIESYQDSIAIKEWSQKHNVRLDDIYPVQFQETIFILKAQWQVKIDGVNLVVYDSQTNQPIHTFCNDARWQSIIIDYDVVIGSDRDGRVTFLRWVE